VQWARLWPEPGRRGGLARLTCCHNREFNKSLTLLHLALHRVGGAATATRYTDIMCWTSAPVDGTLMNNVDSNRFAVSLASVSVLLLAGALGGCGSIEVALGLRTRLDKLPVTAISARLLPDACLVPGKSAHLVITVTTADGKQLTTEGVGHGTVLFDSFKFVTDVVTIKGNGVVSLPADPRLSDAVVPHMGITVIGHSDISAGLDIPVRYDAAFMAQFSGQPGFSGFDGQNGLDGSSGSDGSLDPNNLSAGGNGSDGSSGTDGADGDPGQPGDAVRLWVTLMPERSLLQVKASGKRGDQFFLVDSSAGSLTVKADGGSGGSGGSGGKGGRGGSGGTGFPPGMSGLAGRDGSAGRSGSYGAAGTFIVSVDPRVQPYLDRLHFSNTSDGRSGPPPDIRIEPVPPIW
jgi:hypothetical protein